MEYIPEYEALVLPMVREPFVVGFLVAELLSVGPETRTKTEKVQENMAIDLSLPSFIDKVSEAQTSKEDVMNNCICLTTKQRAGAIMISRSLAMAYVMDQVCSS